MFTHTYRNCSWLADWLSEWNIHRLHSPCTPFLAHCRQTAGDGQPCERAGKSERETDAAVAAIFKCFYRKLTGCPWEENLNLLDELHLTKSVGAVLQIWIIVSSKVMLHSAYHISSLALPSCPDWQPNILITKPNRWLEGQAYSSSNYCSIEVHLTSFGTLWTRIL